MFSFTHNKLYIHREIGSPLYTGFINKEQTLVIHDTDNYHMESKSLGIDEEILNSPKLEYLYIEFKFMKKKYVTTRYYFKTHCREYNLLNLRNLRFMELRLFGLESAIQYEKQIVDEADSQMDIFEIGAIEATSGQKLLDTWVKNLEKTTQQIIDKEKSNVPSSDKLKVSIHPSKSNRGPSSGRRLDI